MASSSTKQLSQKLVTIAGTWTKDPFRPNLQLQNFLKSLAAHPKLTPQSVEATRALRDNDMQKKVCPLQPFSREPTVLNNSDVFQKLKTYLVPIIAEDAAACFFPLLL